jgi:heptosyltransferase-1
MTALGEAVFSLPLLHALRNATPPWRVVSVVRGGSGELIQTSGLADEVLFRIPAFGPRCHLDLIKAVRACRPAVSLALTTSRSSSILAWLSGAPRRIGYDRADFGFLHTARIPSEISGVRNFLNLLGPAGVKRTVSSYAGLLVVPAAAQADAAQLLRRQGIDGTPFVALAPMSSGRIGVKAYPITQWAKVCRLVTDRGWPVVLLGEAADAAAHARILAASNGRAVSLAGMTSALVLAGILGCAACVVGVDTGPVHVAAAVGTRCVALFGPTDPGCTAPCGDGHVILSKHLACQPCLDAPCPNGGACMRLITPAMVADAVEAVVAEGPQSLAAGTSGAAA